MWDGALAMRTAVRAQMVVADDVPTAGMTTAIV
jgi:hypothetical protein